MYKFKVSDIYGSNYPSEKMDLFLLLLPTCPTYCTTAVTNVLVVQLCLTFCDPMDCSPPGSSVYGILQAKIVEWAAMPFSRDLPNPGIKPYISLIGRQILYHLSHQGSPGQN